MEQKLVIFLLGFDVVLQDRRNGEESVDFIVVAYPNEHPESLTNAHGTIRTHFSSLGYEVKEIAHQESRKKELDLKAEYAASGQERE